MHEIHDLLFICAYVYKQPIMHILKFAPNDHDFAILTVLRRPRHATLSNTVGLAQGLDTYYQLTYSNHKMQLKITSTDSLEWETHWKLVSAPKEKNYA